MGTVIVEPSIPFTISRPDLENLRSLLQQYFPTDEVVFGLHERGGGSPLAEVLIEAVNVWLPQAWAVVDEVLLGAIIAEAVSWARERAQVELERRTKKPRAKYISIYGPDGNVIRAVKVEDSEREPEDVTEEVRKLGNLRDRPPVWIPGDYRTPD